MPREVIKEKIKTFILNTSWDTPSVDHVPRHVVLAFPNLQTLQIESEIKEVFGEDFYTSANRSGLIEIKLSRNRLTQIKNSAFIGLSVLERLDLRSNEIHTIENGAFADLSKLQYLNLHNNKIKELKDRVFDGLISLKGLNIRYNTLERLGNSAYTLRSIELMLLDYNRIIDIDFVKLAKLPTLKDLGLERAIVNVTSRTSNIDSEESFQSILRTLNLANNDNTITIDAVNKLLHVFPNLKIMNLGGNRISHRTKGFPQIDQRPSLTVNLAIRTIMFWPFH